MKTSSIFRVAVVSCPDEMQARNIHITIPNRFFISGDLVNISVGHGYWTPVPVSAQLHTADGRNRSSCSFATEFPGKIMTS
jgi:hypothetical protein